MELEKYKSKNPKKIGIILFTIVCVLLVAGVYFAFYVDNELVSEMPLQNSGYILDEENSSCTNEASVTWDYTNWEPRIHNLTKTRTKCTLYFTKTKKVNTVLGEIEVYEYTPDFTKSACDDEICESHEKGIFETTDADGTTYYYRGSVENNYVLFADRYWRIIRINGDGTIRMIYDGTEAHDNGESSTDRQVGTSQFNTAYNNNMYVGYMYTSGEAHGTGTSSIIKTANDNFYTSVLASYSQYIDTDAGFCGDRSALNNQGGVGTGTVTTYNGGYIRAVESDPNLTCSNTSDLYTVSSSNQGNKVLTYPVGLITVDEVLLSGTGGGVFDGTLNHQPTSPNSYLTTGNTFWTMTPAGGYNPFGHTDWFSLVFRVSASGNVDDDYSTSTRGLRPAINIRNDVTINGNGTKDDPFTIS